MAMMSNPPFVLTVTQLNKIVRSTLDGTPVLSHLLLSGEIANFRQQQSGHCYFSLRDESSSLRCVMFSAAAQRVRFLPADGMRVICRGRVSIYEKDGQYQFYAEDMQPDGLGADYLAFLQLKARLEEEGLFSESAKHPLPPFPGRIAVVTSPTGAVWHDIQTVVARRWPLTELQLFPTQVQGDFAEILLCEALRQADASDADLIILARGGGSAEDLSVFNRESVVRAVAACQKPLITALGHETDDTLCDFAADRRAPTPSAAAELAVPDQAEFQDQLLLKRLRIRRAARERLEQKESALRLLLAQSNGFCATQLIERQEERLDHLYHRFCGGVQESMSHRLTQYENTVSRLKLLNPLNRLTNGYAYVSHNGSAVRTAGQLTVGEELSLRFADGAVKCRVTERMEES